MKHFKEGEFVNDKDEIIGNSLLLLSCLVSTQGGTPCCSIGGSMSGFFADPQILIHSFDEPQILSLKILRP